MAHNAFSFDSWNGVVAGLPVSEGIPTLRNDGSMYPPHVKCGDRFIMIDNVKSPIAQKGRVMEAKVRTVCPTDGRAQFRTLSREGTGGILLLLTAHPFDRKIKEKETWVNAWEGIVADDKVETLLFSNNPTSALLHLTEEGQIVSLFLSNGLVHQLRLHQGKVALDHLTHKEMAQLRVDQFESQLAELGDFEADVRRMRGIFGGAIRLLQAVAEDREVRGIFRDFLIDHLPDLTDRMREEIRRILLSVYDLYAGNFIEGYDYNVISLDRVRAASPARKEADSKRARRRISDQEERNKMRGSSNGGNAGQKAGKRK